MQLVAVSAKVFEHQRELLDRWAENEDRSISAVIRRLIDQEEVRKMDTRPLPDLAATTQPNSINDLDLK